MNWKQPATKTSFILYFLFSVFFVKAQSSSSASSEEHSWKIIPTQNLPEKREDCSFVEVKGLFYLIGGRGIKPVEVFNPATLLWQRKNNTPLEMHHFQGVVYKNIVYVIGGMNGPYPHEQPMENIYLYNPQQDEWSKGPEIPPSRRRGSGGCVVYKDRIYFLAGIQDGHYDGTVNWFDVFNPATGKWSVLPDAPHARDHFQTVVIGHKLYVAGGRQTSAKTQQGTQLTVPEIDVFDFKKQTWQTLPSAQNLPTQRAGCTAVAFKGKLVVIGGESVVQQSSHHEAEALDIKNGSWKQLPPLVTGRHDTQALVYKNSIYIVAGSANRGGGPDQNTMEVYK